MGLLAAAEHDSGAVIAQRAIDTKSNEIPELRTLVAGMDLTGTLATADAAHCQKATAEAIVAAGGHYLLILKANQVKLLKAVAPLQAGTDEQWTGGRHDSTDRGHGRTEERLVRVAAADVIASPTPIDCLDRVDLNLSVPNLMVGGQTIGVLTGACQR